MFLCHASLQVYLLEYSSVAVFFYRELFAAGLHRDKGCDGFFAFSLRLLPLRALPAHLSRDQTTKVLQPFNCAFLCFVAPEMHLLFPSFFVTVAFYSAHHAPLFVL